MGAGGELGQIATVGRDKLEKLDVFRGPRRVLNPHGPHLDAIDLRDHPAPDPPEEDC